MNYGLVLDSTYSQFSDDEKLNYGLKIALSRLQTELNRAWYQEPKDFAPKTADALYKNKLPSYSDIKDYYLIDPWCKVNGVSNTPIITDVKVSDVLNNSSFQSGWNHAELINASNCRATGYNHTNLSIKASKLSPRMFTRFRYWENGMTGKNSTTGGGAGSASGGTTTNAQEPENSILSYTGGSLNATRTWKSYNDNIGAGNNEETFFNKLTTASAPIKIIAQANINTADHSDITKAHPFLEIYIQVPTISTRQSADAQNTAGSGTASGTDNIGFFNPVMKQSLGDVEGINYIIRGWAGSVAGWSDLTIETGATDNTNILYYLNNPGFILVYGVKNIQSGLFFSYTYPPLISFIKYTGETFADGIIPQGLTADLPPLEVSNVKDLYIDTEEGALKYLTESEGTKEWKSISGGGGGGAGATPVQAITEEPDWDNLTLTTQGLGVFKGRMTANAIYISGDNTLPASVSGANNTTLGVGAGLSLTTGTNNTLIGYNSGSLSAIVGNYNSCLGDTSGKKLTSGAHNTFVGSGAGTNDTTGGYNSCVGLNSGLNIASGHNNTAIGRSSGQNMQGCSNCICIGYDAGPTWANRNIDSKLFIDSVGAAEGMNSFIYGDMTAAWPQLCFNVSDLMISSYATVANHHAQEGIAFRVKPSSTWSGNCSSYIKFKEDEDEEHGFAIGYCADQLSGGMNGEMGWLSDTFNIQRFNNSTTGATCLTIKRSDGNVGIGTNGPKAKLSVDAGAVDMMNLHLERTNTTTNPTVHAHYYLHIGRSEGTTNTKYLMGFGYLHNETSSSPAAYIGYQRTVTNGYHYGDLIFGTRSGVNHNDQPTERMRIKSNGYVGIGCDPSYKLDVGGAMRISNGSRIVWDNPTCAIEGNSATQGNNGGNLYFKTNMEYRMCVIENGNVGIGTTTPQTELSVKGSDNGGISIIRTGDNYHWRIFNSDSNTLTFQGRNADNNIRANCDDLLCLYDAGRIGIGTATPSHHLHVVGETQYYLPTNYYWAQNSSNLNQHGANNQTVSARFSNGIWTEYHIFNSSDRRIKENIVDVPDDLALQMVRDIPCRYYEYKDKLNRGIEKTIGFIAQEVKEVLPMVVSIQTDIIPNEMRQLEDISWEEENEKYKLTTDLQDCSGIKYRFYVSNDPSGNDEIQKEIIGNPDNTFTFDSSYNNVFCYGKEVDDFHTIDKQKIFAFHHSAIQEIDRKQLADKAEIAELKTEVATLKSELAAIKTHLGI